MNVTTKTYKTQVVEAVVKATHIRPFENAIHEAWNKSVLPETIQVEAWDDEHQEFEMFAPRIANPEKYAYKGV